ncbi:MULTISPECIES: DUF6344 domain-containing protein [unclassified Streptomyces]|uniref:DUF6344 domain-containing protein n=1 Tax=unclassified Streptomyces TaxID=2593676 RepID=UPI0006AEEED3|nr:MULTISPECIES: DUF6344 domain-containing protein [unclassified Streptomyces]KOX38515.1 hypothetical protein ADL06_00305 [Streptomyces sp. NRRL F-6491]KOX52662.1 hypothetical protein ADL08_00865 [Streptomyces sp. NRRL F-6492]
MATAKVKQFWAAFISVLFALLASVGLTGTAAAAQQPAVQQPEEPAAPAAVTTSAAAGERASASVPAQRAHRWPLAGDRSLPPTIKQRIAAEAHGSSPAARQRSSASAAPESDPAALTELALASAA